MDKGGIEKAHLDVRYTRFAEDDSAIGIDDARQRRTPSRRTHHKRIN